MVEILIGPIASGKSTYCRKRAEEGAITINDDSITNALHGGNYRLYDKALKPLYKQIEMVIMSTGVAMGRDIIVDRPNFLKSTRMRYINMAKALDVNEIHGVIFPNAGFAEHAKRRFNSDSRGVSLEEWTAIAKHHEGLFEKPSVDEGFTKLYNKEEK